jgi:hypothetical protein
MLRLIGTPCTAAHHKQHDLLWCGMGGQIDLAVRSSPFKIFR